MVARILSPLVDVGLDIGTVGRPVDGSCQYVGDLSNSSPSD